MRQGSHRRGIRVNEGGEQDFEAAHPPSLDYLLSPRDDAVVESLERKRA
jgi:hypothetical protein